MMDSTNKNNQMDVFVGVKMPRDSNAVKKYRINKVSIYTEYDPKLMLMNDADYLKELDTLDYQEVRFIYWKK